MKKWIWIPILIVFALIAIPIATLQVGQTTAETDQASATPQASDCDLSASQTNNCAAFGDEITGQIPGLSAVGSVVNMIPLALYAAIVIGPVGYIIYRRRRMA